MGGDEPRFRVLHVSNISMSATKEQIYQLFAFIGRIDEFKMYPTDGHPQLSTFTQKFAYVKFEESKSVEVAQHLTNTVFIDRALVCIPSISDTVPDEETALKTGGPAWPGQRQLPPNVVNQIQDLGDGQQMLLTVDPTLTALGLPPYPALSANTDASKVEEIRRTVYVGNLPKDCDPHEVMRFFNDNIGEVMYLRMASGNENLPCAYAYIEFTNQPTVPIALQNNGIEFKDRCLRIQHSRVAIIKPERKTADMALQEVEEAIRVNQNPEKSSSALSKLNQGLGIDRAYSPLRRSLSPIRRRSRSRDRRRRSRSRSRSRRRRSRSRDRRSRSRDRRRRSRSRDRDRRRSRSRDRKDKDKDRHGKDRDRGKDKEKERKDRKRSRSKTPKRKDEKDKDRRREKEKESERKKDKDKGREKDKEKEKRRDNRSERSRREKEKERDKETDKKSSKDKEKDSEERSRRKSESAKSSAVKADVKLQIEDGEGMEVDTVASSSEESRIRERLLEKVMARNGGSNSEQNDEPQEHDEQKDKNKESEKRAASDEEGSVENKNKKKRSRASSLSSSGSSSSESD
ncbi:putative splicing factor, arginine/serine-rich 7 [Toxocara canis]|uniref:Putative splicing factor, arginine/serine-rich 7 n=1 Tax=Toxocara canis TaxID=6265 RepID=A0A0B2V6A8_TOXCA|nr:putative splicing factor, arginine/serine-rich 7 [Toxocara canis]